MKTINFFLILIFIIAGNISCSDEWDTHYSPHENKVNNEHVAVVNSNAVDYLKSESAYSEMLELFQVTGVIESMQSRDQSFTIMVVNNNALNNGFEGNEDKVYLAKSHISDISLSPENLSDGLRLFTWTGKAVNVLKKEKGLNGDYQIQFNNARVTKVIKTNDAYIYEIDSYIIVPKSLYEILESLGDNYSIFRNMVLSRNQKEFDRDASIPIGVDNTGSTVYDSIFITTNPYFLAHDFDIMSESITATMLIPSNEVVNNALNTAKESLSTWGLTRNDTILENWIFESAFFNQQYQKQDFIDNEDLTSVFGKQWRTSIQQVDLDNPIQMSNGMAYYIKSMKIPTNVLIYRIKDYFKWYEFLTESDKQRYFTTTNLVFDKVVTEVEGWSGWPAAGFPLIENRVLYFKLENPEIHEYSLNFVPFQFRLNNDGSYTASPYLIPPGEYDFCLGFKQNLGHDVEVSFNGEFIRTITTTELTSTTFHYDRGGQGYPEGYDVNRATDKKKGNYDRDGGRVGVVTIEGNETVPVEITIHGKNVTNNRTILHHWCLRPTKNCY
jgi:hypothetical protein